MVPAAVACGCCRDHVPEDWFESGLAAWEFASRRLVIPPGLINRGIHRFASSRDTSFVGLLTQWLLSESGTQLGVEIPALSTPVNPPRLRTRISHEGSALCRSLYLCLLGQQNRRKTTSCGRVSEQLRVRIELHPGYWCDKPVKH